MTTEEPIDPDLIELMLIELEEELAWRVEAARLDVLINDKQPELLDFRLKVLGFWMGSGIYLAAVWLSN